MFSPWVGFFAVALGGALGAILRWMITLLTKQQLLIKNFPIATLFANFLGSFLLGIFIVLCVEKQLMGENWRLFLTVGLTGSLTTFATFSLETLQLIQKENYLFAFYNITLNLTLTFFAVWAAFFLARFFTH